VDRLPDVDDVLRSDGIVAVDVSVGFVQLHELASEQIRE
jgi:hypothetical protein